MSDRQKRGMAMVELVFVLPLLLLLIFAIAEFGLMFNRYLTLNNAVREGARHAAMFRGGAAKCNAATPPFVTQVEDRVLWFANGAGLPLQRGDITVTGACGAVGMGIRVDASYLFPLHIPFAPIPAVTLRATATMRNEG